MFVVGGRFDYNFSHGYNQYTMHNPVGNMTSFHIPYPGNDQGKISLQFANLRLHEHGSLNFFLLV